MLLIGSAIVVECVIVTSVATQETIEKIMAAVLEEDSLIRNSKR